MYVAYVAFGLCAVLMVLAILLQEGKGGGLSALGGTQAESAFGASNPIRRATVILSIIFFILAGVLTYVRSGRRVKFNKKGAGAVEQSFEKDAGEPAADAEAVGVEASVPIPPAAEGEADGSAPAKPAAEGETDDAAPAEPAGEGGADAPAPEKPAAEKPAAAPAEGAGAQK
jgi:protein translocase SecG subunit